MIKMIFAAFLTLALFVGLGTVTIVLLGGVFAAAGWFLGLIAAVLDVIAWGAAIYFIIKLVTDLF